MNQKYNTCEPKRAFDSELWVQSAQNEAFRKISLHYTAPLLPHQSGVLLFDEMLKLHVVCDVFFVKTGLHVFPSLAIPEDDVLVFELHIISAKVEQLHLHAFHSFVVDTQKGLDGGLWNPVKVEQKHGHLSLQGFRRRKSWTL